MRGEILRLLYFYTFERPEAPNTSENGLGRQGRTFVEVCEGQILTDVDVFEDLEGTSLTR